jgi:hypothetical protein
LNGLAVGLILSMVVERAKKCLDFAVTLFFLHFLMCWYYAGVPTLLLWWGVNVASTVLSAVSGEWLCTRRPGLVCRGRRLTLARCRRHEEGTARDQRERLHRQKLPGPCSAALQRQRGRRRGQRHGPARAKALAATRLSRAHGRGPCIDGGGPVGGRPEWGCALLTVCLPVYAGAALAVNKRRPCVGSSLQSEMPFLLLLERGREWTVGPTRSRDWAHRRLLLPWQSSPHYCSSSPASPRLSCPSRPASPRRPRRGFSVQNSARAADPMVVAGRTQRTEVRAARGAGVGPDAPHDSRLPVTGRGVIPDKGKCADGLEKSAGLCYHKCVRNAASLRCAVQGLTRAARCPSDMKGLGPLCWDQCKSPLSVSALCVCALVMFKCACAPRGIGPRNSRACARRFQVLLLQGRG